MLQRTSLYGILGDALCVALGWIIPYFLFNMEVENDTIIFLQMSSTLLVGLRSLFLFVMMSTSDIYTQVLSGYTQSLSIGVLLTYAVTTILGGPIFSKFWETFFFCCFTSSMIFLPVGIKSSRTVVQVNNQSSSIHDELPLKRLIRVLLKHEFATEFELYMLQTAFGTIFGSWFGAFMMPLDWDTPQQKWPVSLFYGANIGFLVGAFVFLVTTIARRIQEGDRSAKSE